MIVCPICAGTGTCVYSNGVDPQKQNEKYTCWMCAGIGNVIEVRHEEKIHIRKYYGAMEG